MAAGFLSAFASVVSGNSPWTVDDELVWRVEAREPGSTHRIEFSKPRSLAHARKAVGECLSVATLDRLTYVALLGQTEVPLSQSYPREDASWSPSACELEGLAQLLPSEVRGLRWQAEDLVGQAEWAADKGDLARAEQLRVKIEKLSLVADCWERLAALHRGWDKDLWEGKLSQSPDDPRERLALFEAVLRGTSQVLRRYEAEGETARVAQCRYELRRLQPVRDSLVRMLSG